LRISNTSLTFAASLLVAAVSGVETTAMQTAKPAQLRADINLPPISYVCPMAGDEDVIEDHAGKCRKCGMELVAIRLDSVWTCATRPLLVVSAQPGKCPVDGTPLVQVTAAVSWTCPGSDKESIAPGTCPDGSAMQKKYAQRAHGNHNPQHGGQFFMAADNWHHLEGTYLPSGIFRLHLYDDFTKPLPIAQVRMMTAEVVINDPRSGQEKKIPLVRTGRYLQAAIGKVPLPAKMYAHVQFKSGGPHNRFDFAFETYSKEPAAGAAPTATMTSAMPAAPMPATNAANPVTAAATPTSAAAAPEVSSGVDPALVPLPIPDNVPEMLSQLRTRTEQIRAIIDRGSFASIYVPAFQAKDLALALDAHKQELPAERRKIAEPAITRLVRSAWLLDAFGDIGNKQQITQAYDMFVAAAKEIQAAFPSQP
jgi:hypothetical protein